MDRVLILWVQITKKPPSYYNNSPNCINVRVSSKEKLTQPPVPEDAFIIKIFTIHPTPMYIESPSNTNQVMDVQETQEVSNLLFRSGLSFAINSKNSQTFTNLLGQPGRINADFTGTLCEYDRINDHWHQRPVAIRSHRLASPATWWSNQRVPTNPWKSSGFPEFWRILSFRERIRSHCHAKL